MAVKTLILATQLSTEKLQSEVYRKWPCLKQRITGYFNTPVHIIIHNAKKNKTSLEREYLLLISLLVFDDFRKISGHFPKISKMFRRSDKCFRTFSEDYRKLAEIAEDNQRRSAIF